MRLGTMASDLKQRRVRYSELNSVANHKLQVSVHAGENKLPEGFYTAQS